ncbi:MAG: hypothetical protein IJL98_03570 [Lachnospiraceae bacterium]|nr:hypothetical protein [Lachnospiraceae bacterium]
MKRALTLLCAVMLVLLPLAGAHAASSPKNGYILPEELKKIPAKASAVALPEGLPEPARVTEFSVSDTGRLTLKLDREVPKLVVTEINFVDAVENTIFSRKNTDSADAHRTGNEDSIFNVYIYWGGDTGLTQEYNTWNGPLEFARASLSDDADGANAEYTFREDGTLISETRTVEDTKDRFVRTVTFGEDGKTESCMVSWRQAGFGGYVLDAGFSPDGKLTGLECRTDDTAFTLRSEALDADDRAKLILRENCYDPISYDEVITEKYRSISKAAMSYATMTDLPPVEEADTKKAKGARIWVLSFGDFFDYEEYVFIAKDPLFILKDKKAVPNSKAKDLNGEPIDFSAMPEVETPVFEAPRF